MEVRMIRPSRRLSSHLALALLASALVATASASATSFVRVSDEALVERAPLIAVVRVDGVVPTSQPFTDYSVSVEELLKGDLAEPALVVRVPGGGPADGIRLKVYGAPRFALGERALLFLEPHADGRQRVHQLFLGAFHEVAAGRRRLALRNLSSTSEVRARAEGGLALEPGAAGEPLRDFDEFVRWVSLRAHGLEAAADYLVADPAGELRRQVEPFSIFEDPDTGRRLRWFVFDSGGSVPFRAHQSGQTGVTGGGFSEFQTALQAWNADPQTPIDYDYAGTTADTSGLIDYDTVNAILFNDPNGELPAFNCASGGVLAYGGPWYQEATTPFNGVPHHRILNADIVINNGLACFFASSPGASKAAQELFGHELGHTLGLGHACGDSDGPDPDCNNDLFDDALMRAFVHDDLRGARLNADDRAGIISLYAQAPAAPDDLFANALTTSTIHLTWDDNSNDEDGFRIEARTLTGDFAEVATAAANATAADVGGLPAATTHVFRLRAENDEGLSAYSNEATATTDGPVGTCTPDAQHLCLQGGRFRVNVDWQVFDGSTGVGTSVPVPSTDSGLFYFFNENNWEMLIKVLNGCPVNDSYWVFFAATTNVEFVVTVVDTQSGRAKQYLNPLDHVANAVTDTSAFATCP
jgi:hypothetical protein